MARSVEVLDESEELAARPAIETVRALRKAMQAARPGEGLATMEATVRDKGMDHLRQMFDRVVREHPEAQKKGPARTPFTLAPARHSAPHHALQH